MIPAQTCTLGRHATYWLASCDGCREARTRTLRSVQSCTVQPPDQRLRDLLDPGSARALEAVGWGR